MRATLDSSVTIEDCPPEIRAAVLAAFTVENPGYAMQRALAKAERADHDRMASEGIHTRLRHAFSGEPQQFLQLAAEDGNRAVCPRGLALDRLRSLGLPIRVADRRVLGRPLSARLADGVEPRDYQMDASWALLERQQGTLVAGTGAGKTVTALCTIIGAGRNALVTVHTSLIQKGWRDEILGSEKRKKRAILDGDFQVSLIRGSADAAEKAKAGGICIAMIQTLARLPPDHEFWKIANEQFGTVIHDEGHHAAAASWVYVNELLKQRYRYCLTATPNRKDGLGFLLDYTVGPVVYTVSDAMLMERGFIQRPTVTFVHTDYYPDCEARDINGEMSDDVSKNMRLAKSKFARNELLQNLIHHRGRNTLICDWMEYDWKRGAQQAAVTQRVEHTHILAGLLRERGMVVEPLIGAIKEKDRERIVEGIAQGKIDAIIGTSVLDEGLDVPNLSAIHLTCPTSNDGKLKQQVGRCRRPSPLPCVVRDYVDIRCPAVITSYETRRRVYREAAWVIEGTLKKALVEPPAK